MEFLVLLTEFRALSTKKKQSPFLTEGRAMMAGNRPFCIEDRPLLIEYQSLQKAAFDEGGKAN